MTSAPRTAAGQRKTLKAMKARVKKMALQWDEVDQFLMAELERVVEHIEDCEATLVIYSQEYKQHQRDLEEGRL